MGARFTEWAAVRPRPKRSKYRAQRTTIDGQAFASKREASRYQQLRLLERAGRIANLELQPAYPLFAPALHAGADPTELIAVGTYYGDFRYRDVERQVVVLEDVKGVKTTAYALKKRIVEAQYGVQITEVR